MNGIFAPSFPIDGLKNLIEKVPPVVPKPTKEGAVYVLGLLSATGTGILLAAIVGGLVMKYDPVQLLSTYARTVWLVRYSLLTIVLMLALGTLTRYSGTDTTLGLAFADILLRQRVAVNMQNRSTRTSMVGVDVAMSVALAATGLTGMQHADGEILAARAAEKFGVPFALSTMSICSIEDVAAHTKSPFWF